MHPWDGQNARDFFVEGQLVKASKEGLATNRHRRSLLLRGQVFGFSRKYPWCIIIKRDGIKYPESYAGDFWEPA
jgi:hypothetical protein